MKHRVKYVFETEVEAESKREAKKIAKQMLKDGRIGEPKCSCISICPKNKPESTGSCYENCGYRENGICTLNDTSDKLDVIDIGNFCLLVDKYKNYIEQGQAVSDNKNVLQDCSDSISALLEIMDTCQNILYTTGYSEENIELMKKCELTFKEGIESLSQILKGFTIMTTTRKQK